MYVCVYYMNCKVKNEDFEFTESRGLALININLPENTISYLLYLLKQVLKSLDT